jgi:hypothetical protein
MAVDPSETDTRSPSRNLTGVLLELRQILREVLPHRI